MVDPFGEISFLTRSENRVRVLTTLADAPYSERDLVAETGISDVTVGRILEDFADRGWILEEDDHYRTTRAGDLLAADYRQLENSMDLVCRIAPVREYLPIAEMDFDFRHLTDARISDPDRFDSLRAVDRWKQLLREADRVVGTAPEPTATTVVAEPYHAEITAGNLEFDVVVSRAYYETARARPEMRPLLREILQAGGQLHLATEEEFAAQVALFDNLATMSGYDEAGNLRAGIESSADPVREWVRETYEAYREDARPLTTEDFAE